MYRPLGESPDAGSDAHVTGAFGWALVVERGPQAGLTYVLANGSTEVGRGSDSGIFLGDVTVSRQHAVLHVDDTGLRIEDHGSTNGVYVNGVLREAAILHPNDEVIIGKFRLRVARGND